MPLIFVSYRRTDAPGHAGRLFDRLIDRFGEASVFRDLDSMEPGADFAEVIRETVGRCDALIAVIGQGWLTADRDGARRLDDPQDWVRLEIANALERGIRVIPVLVHGASMPDAADLPDELRRLARRHGVVLSELAWRPQVDQLIDSLERALAQPITHTSRPAIDLAPIDPEPAGESLAISRAQIHEIIDHATREAPNICCGIVVGELGTATSVHPMQNLAASPYRFDIDQRELTTVIIELEDDKTLLAIYHSVTRWRPYPSQLDMSFAAAWPGVHWLIVGLRTNTAPDTRLYVIEDGAVREAQIEVT